MEIAGLLRSGVVLYGIVWCECRYVVAVLCCCSVALLL